MKETLYNGIWGLGIRLRNLAKRASLLGAFELTLLRWASSLIHPPIRDVEVALPWGVSMVVPSGYTSARSLAIGLYETHVTKLFEAIVREGMIVADVGASIGYYTLLTSRMVGLSGRVYAFEPNPRSCTYLLRNIDANGCSNVTVVERAASDKIGLANLVCDRANNDESWLSTSSSGPVCVVVETVTLDAFFAKEVWPSVGLIKMDIEGGEKAALEGMRELSRRNPRMQLIMEWYSVLFRRAGVTPEGLAATLRELGFCTAYIIERGLAPVDLSKGAPDIDGCYNLLLRKE